MINIMMDFRKETNIVTWYWLLVSAWIGVVIGVMTTCLCVASKMGDEKIQNIKYGN